MNKNPMLEAALSYAARGWRVFPVTPGRKAPPLISEWQHKATTDSATIRGWWDQWPTANVAIATGAESGLVVVDVDPRSGGLETLPGLNLPPTVTAHTPSVYKRQQRGLALLLRAPRWRRTNPKLRGQGWARNRHPGRRRVCCRPSLDPRGGHAIHPGGGS